jgi:hypothetical protein
MGLGWQSLASSGAKPLWQALYEGNVFDEQVTAFYLTRFQNASRAQEQELGGVSLWVCQNCPHAADFL